MAWTLKSTGPMMQFGRQNRSLCAAEPPDEDREKREAPDESPETPTDEPSPQRVQDPPPQPDSQGPYVVTVYEH